MTCVQKLMLQFFFFFSNWVTDISLKKDLGLHAGSPWSKKQKNFIAYDLVKFTKGQNGTVCWSDEARAQLLYTMVTCPLCLLSSKVLHMCLESVPAVCDQEMVTISVVTLHVSGISPCYL